MFGPTVHSPAWITSNTTKALGQCGAAVLRPTHILNYTDHALL